MSESPDFPFEFERKFLVSSLPDGVAEHGAPQVIIQAYVFAEAGYAIRVRLSFRGATIKGAAATPTREPARPEVMDSREPTSMAPNALEVNSADANSPDANSADANSADANAPEPTPPAAKMPVFDPAVDELGAYERRLLAQLLKDNPGLAVATVAVKSPSINGERYEMETELDPDVAVQIIQRSGRIVAKTRHSLWVGEDGWEFDVFAGQNAGLIVAEIERLTPVVDLEIPEFCVTEVTADPRFTNDSLSKTPWQHWDGLYMAELAQRGPFFLNLGENS
ncbi:adenylate cyclase [Trueperella pecoris]|uniref:Adenylate cyclase n=1 Tax=Trueperella pecoris TaxID=2733571 RepID=A0A7M1R1Y8_9ACTO|nr:adenylate cyclase [Trueperella pecoris]QOR47704.1 adenylate cyclase [Trueperella pecoris]